MHPVLRCLSGICGGDAPVKPRGVGLNAAFGVPGADGVNKPVLRLDESDDIILEPSVEFLIERFEMKLAPPGVNPPLALVSSNYRQSSQRTLVLVPSAGAPFGCWDTDFPDGRGASVPLLQWAEANNYGVALFSAAALEAAPAQAWDTILSGSPARHVTVLVATRGALELLHRALEPVHEIMITRIRIIAMPWEGVLPESASPALASTLPPKPKHLRMHLKQAQMHWPDEWAFLEPGLMRQRLFEMLKEKEDAWQAQEAAKYGGLESLKENDVPGLRRLGVGQRVARLNRDRDTDELSRLIGKHSAARGGADEEDEEPGVD